MPKTKFKLVLQTTRLSLVKIFDSRFNEHHRIKKNVKT